MLQRNPQILVFDLGGVIVKHGGVKQVMSWLPEGTQVDEMWRMWIQSPTVRSFETGKISPQVFSEKIVQELSLPLTSLEFLQAFESWPQGLFPEVEEFLGQLSSFFPLYSLSNTNEVHWEKVREYNLDTYFSRHFLSHEMGMVKPDKEVFEFVLQELECPPDLLLFLDDNIQNVEVAESLGIQSVQVSDFKDARDKVRRILADESGAFLH